MTGQPQAFLAPGALTDERVRQALSGVLDTWSRTYFTTAAADVSGAEKPGSRTTNNSPSAAGSAALLLTVPGKRRLLEAALGQSLDGKVWHEADRQLLDAFAERLVAELARLLDRELAPERGPSLRLDFTIDGRVLGTLTVSYQAIVARVRKALPTKIGHVEFATSRLGAVAHLPVPIEAVLGRSRLTVEDANGLAVGDVLILDRELEQDAEVRVGKHRSLVAHGRLVPDKGRNTIVVGKTEKGLN